MQARLKEIHADLLRKHLERLEQPVETERGSESDKEIENVEENATHDVDGMPFCNPLVLFRNRFHL